MEVEYTPPPSNKTIAAGTYAFEILKYSADHKTETDREKLKNLGYTSEQINEAEGEISFLKIAFTFLFTSKEGEPITAKETFTLTPTLAWKLKVFRIACGFKDEEGRSNKINLEQMVGCTGSVVVTIKKKSNGDGDFNNFTWLKPTVSSNAEPF